MRRIAFGIALLLSVAASSQAQGSWSFKGTVIRMRMAECTAQKGFMAAMSGSPVQVPSSCPEYTIVGDKVVYVVVGRHAEEFMPLAENMDFLIRKNELVLFSDDEKARSRFAIQQMTLRGDWEREEAQKEAEARAMERSANYQLRNPASRTSMISSNSR
ncbi:MAG TPA: hypothetical protein VM578_08205 [Candidatus Saccharimonadales bacterium]|nr:hypothetical protein [Candidatus Saccharimonadales bacterium]